MSELYSDFELTEETCHREPIHRPEAIQGSGHLLAFGAGERAPLLAISADTASLFGIEESTVWEQGLHALPAELLNAIEPYREAALEEVSEGGLFTAQDHSYALICHWHHDVFFVELENADPIQLSTTVITRFSESARSVTDLEALCQMGAASLRDALGYDRVMVYKFDPDGHGMVVGEAKDASLEPFLGLHYPATDIPQNARDLFKLNRTRSIPGVRIANRPIHFRANHFQEGDYLDLSRCQLRATSPVHVQYLENMGVAATLTIAIVLRGELWGLFACHHNTPRDPSLQTRLRAEILSTVFTQRLHEIEAEQIKQFETQSRLKEEAFIETLRVEEEYQLRVMHVDAPLLELCACDGAVVVSGVSKSMLKKGLVPSDAVITALRDWLVECEHDAVFATDMMQDVLPQGMAGAGDLGGVLAVRVSEISESYIFWFRVEQRQEVTWAGDPRNAGLAERPMPDGKARLSPRRSFEKWNEQIDTRSLAWEPWTLAMATRLRDGILKLELRHTADLVTRANREFMQLTFAAAHDLQEPLRTQLNYLEFLEEEFDAGKQATIQRFLQGSRGAVTRMQHLVNDLLAYAQLGRQMTWESISLNALMNEIFVDIEMTLNANGGSLTWGDLPDIVGDRSNMRQLLQNLVSNAVKYVAPDQAPVVEVFVRENDRSFDLCVCDNGIGIREEDQERVFSMFTRLHHRSDYTGTGIGLAIAKRAAENQSGTLSVSSKAGEGSTFQCRFHTAQLVQ